MELIKTKMGRVGNNKKYEGKLFISIRNTRGTMTDATAEFLGIEDTKMIGFYKFNDKVYIRLATNFELDFDSFKSVSRVNGRFGMHTKSLVSSGEIEAGEYELKTPPMKKQGKEWYELEKINK